MVSWHEVCRRDGTRTGKLVRCHSDPCHLHSDDIEAGSIEDAYRVFNERGGRSRNGLSKRKRAGSSGVRGEVMGTSVSLRTVNRALYRRGVHRHGYRHSFDDLPIVVRGVDSKRLGGLPGIDSVRVIGYASHDGYEYLSVMLPKRVYRSLGLSDGHASMVLSVADGRDARDVPINDSRVRELDGFGLTGSGGSSRQMNPSMLIPRYGGKPISRVHFNGVVDSVASSVTKEDWSHLVMLSERLNDLIDHDDMGVQEARGRILDALESDSDEARGFRAYCGDDVRMEDVADLIVMNVGAMTQRVRYGSNRSSSLRRAVLSSTSNDMNKRRYIASVMFFGGRCCYCGVPLHKGRPGGQQLNDTATGEHLDPLNGHPPGETKFGNMALCCYRCNTDKSDKPMEQWLSSTHMLSPGQVKSARDGIRSFRDFAFYEPMDERHAKFVDASLDELNMMRDSNATSDEIRARIRGLVFDFQSL